MNWRIALIHYTLGQLLVVVQVGAAGVIEQN